MAERHSRLSRLGLSWFSALRGQHQSQSQSQPSRPSETPAGAQRPPFRPAGKSPRQPPPSHSQAPQKTETQTPSSSRASQPRATSVPSSQPRSSNQPQAASTPSRITSSQPQKQAARGTRTSSKSQPEKQAARDTRTPSQSLPQKQASEEIRSKPQPEKEAARETETQSQSASEPTAAREIPLSSSSTQQRQTHEDASETSSPLRKVESSRKESSKPSPASFKSTYQEAAKAEVSQALSREDKPNAENKSQQVVNPSASQKPSPELKPKAESKVEHASNSKNKEEVLSLPSRKPSPETKSMPEPVSTAETKSKETEETKRTVEQLKKEDKSTGQVDGEPKEQKISKVIAPTSDKGKKTTSSQGQKFKESFGRETKASSSRGLAIRNLSSSQSKAKNATKETTTHQRSLTVSGEKALLHREIKEEISKMVQKMVVGNNLKPLTDDKPVSIITVAGENRGSTMNLNQPKKDGFLHIHRGYKAKPHESPEAKADQEEEETSGVRKSKSKDQETNEDKPSKAYINSNVQSINNSLLFSTSLSERNPGVHYGLSYKPAECTKPCTKSEPLVPRRAESNVTPVEKRTYEPTVRRRCLRGLFLEPSDSDPDNPNKPRRHGCKFSCEDQKF